MKKIAIFASGSGTNTQCIAEYFQNKNSACVALILTNKADAYVIERARRLAIPYLVFDKNDLLNETFMLNHLKKHDISLIVLAGFLLKIPPYLIEAYPQKIINIHPALLPKYGGKGMYGNNVHKAVLNNNEHTSGISIHYVNDHYDEGAVIFQKETTVEPSDNIETLAAKIHQLEYTYYPRVIENILNESAD